MIYCCNTNLYLCSKGSIVADKIKYNELIHYQFQLRKGNNSPTIYLSSSQSCV
jgi:hypothetical protein